MEANHMTIDEIAKTILPDMVENRRYMHMHPEVSFQEDETYEYILERLKRYPGITIREGVGGGGLLATIGSAPHPHIAIRADFDALPIQDEKDVPYKSTVDGVMHACGHDAHTSTLLALLELVHRNATISKAVSHSSSSLPKRYSPAVQFPWWRTVCLMALTRSMASTTEPVPDTPDQDEARPRHLEPRHVHDPHIGQGRACSPAHNAVDPVVIAAELITNLQTAVSRQVSPLDNAVVTVGKVRAGDAFNVIPDSTELVGTVRTFEHAVKEKIRDIFHQEARLTAEKRGATAEVDYSFGYPAVVNHEPEAAVIQQAAEEIGLDFEEAKPLMIGEDFSYYINERPGAFFFTGSGNAEKLSDYVHHHPKFDMDEEAMESGLSMFMKILEIEQVIEWKQK